MAPPISTITDSDHETSQQHLSHQDKSLHTHLVTKHEPHLAHDITGHTANDLPDSGGGGANFSPGIAKANVAATFARPDGTTEGGWNEKHAHETVLQQHSSYWDTDRDGVIWPTDTYRGVAAWGWSTPLCLLVVLIIHGGLSYATNSSYIPDPFFRVFQKRVHRAKHGSDSMIYDNQGRFRSQSFEELFANYDRGNKGGLNMGDIWNAWYGQRNAFDPFGWSAFAFEWIATYLLLWPSDGVMRKEDVRRVYDGSIFQVKADEYAEKKAEEVRQHGPQPAVKPAMG